MRGPGNIGLTLAINDYDHVRDLVTGVVRPAGIDLTALILEVEETFFRFSQFREWEVSELSLGKFVSLRDRDEVVGIPVFPSRVFRHSALFVAADSALDDPAQLNGKRIGYPEWTQTATVYVRGLLQDEYRVGLEDVEWVQAGVNQPGRVEGIDLEPPARLKWTLVRDRTLNDMLLTGEVDAVISAHPPAGLRDGRIRRLIAGREVEEQYFRRTGVFPIMHTVALRRDVYERHPWIAMNLLQAFEQAKARSLARCLSATASLFPVPWGRAFAEELGDVFGPNLWPYGAEDNRATLETFLRYCSEQGLTQRLLGIDDLFVPEVRTAFRI